MSIREIYGNAIYINPDCLLSFKVKNTCYKVSQNLCESHFQSEILCRTKLKLRTKFKRNQTYCHLF